MSEITQLRQAIAVLEAQAATLGEEVVSAALTTLRERLAILEASAQPVLPAAESKSGEPQRKQITVLFADISGFTAWSESQDAEDVSEIINALWQRLDAAILQNGGKIDKHIGDAVMALWGAETAQEDDAEQAIYAALAMQSILKNENATPSTALQVRIGIHTGPVLLGEIGATHEFAAIGDTVNVASRLEHAAPVGGILISHETYNLTRGLFVFRALEPLVIKGKADALRVYQVEAPLPPEIRVATRGLEGVETPLVGRASELGILQNAFATTMGAPQTYIITIVGEAGVGKSRLLYELGGWLDLRPGRVRYFHARAVPHSVTTPYATLRSLFAFRFEIRESDNADVVRHKFEWGVRRFLGEGSELQAHCLGAWLGYDFCDSPYLAGVLNDARQLHERALTYLVQFFSAAAGADSGGQTRGETVLLIEDLHWADNQSLEALQLLARRCPGLRLFIVCAARPTLYERYPTWGEEDTSAQTESPVACWIRLDLQPFSAEDSRLLIANLLHRAEFIPPELYDLIVALSEGNPYYIEELLKMLMDDGVIVTQHSPWQVDTARLADLRVPTTLTGVLQARLDSLAPMEKGILQRASIFGRVFWDQAVQALLDQPPTADSVSPDWHEILEESLHHLRRRELILHHETSTIEQAAEFTFKHALLRDVTYERVLKRERRIYHARAARWLAEATQRIGRGDEYAAIIAAHHEQAGETSQAADWYQRAGVQAATQFANAEAIRCLTRALELTPETETAARYDLLRAREKVYDLMGDRQNQAQELDQLTALADQLGDDRRRAEAALRRAVYNQQITDFQGCIEAAKQAISLSQSPDTAQTAAEAQLQWGVALIRLADYVAARPHIEDALALSRAGHWANVEAESLRSFNLIAYQQGDYDAARAYSHQALNISRRTGDRRGEIRALNAIATSENLLGNYDMARDYLEQALHISREIGDRYWEAILLSNLGVTAFFTGDYAVSRQFHSEAQHKYHEVRHWLGESVAIGNIGDASFQMGDYAAARAFHEEALRTRRALGDRVGEAHMLVWLGKYARLDRDEETARNYFQQALDLASSINARHEQATTLQALANWHADHEQWAEAATFYQQALDLRRATHQSRLSLEPLAGLARVALAQGEIPQALEYAEQIMNQSSEIKPDNLFEPVWVYLMCYRVLKAAQDARYTILLKDTYAMLQHMAERLGEEDLKHGFLTNIATHRDLLAEWAQR